MRLNNKISLTLAVVLSLLPNLVKAAPAAAASAAAYDVNMVLISLVGLMLILLFVIGMLANTLRQLSYVLKDKNRKDKSAKATVKALLVLLGLTLPALQLGAAEVAAKADEVAAPVSNFINGIPKDDFYAIMSMITLELVVIFALAIYIRLLMKVISAKPELAAAGQAIARKSWFWDKFNAAATIEQEKDILLDHNYDGIQELDNSLPPWWKYGFYLTIVVGIIYVYRYHFSHDGLSQQEEFAEEMQMGEEAKAAYLANSANNVDENTVTILTGSAEIAEGKELFSKNCVACHLADGGGSVGPNFADEYWLHGGGIKDIFKSIKYGWQEKGMKSWKDDFSPKQIQELATYVLSFKGTKPATPKAPQGELYIEAGAAPVTADSAKAVETKTSDTTKVEKGK